MADRSLEEIAGTLNTENDGATATASGAGSPPPPPSPRITAPLVQWWAKMGCWAAREGVRQRHLEREQLNGVRRGLAGKVNETSASLRDLETALTANFLRVKTDPEGNAVFSDDGLPIMVRKTPEDFPIDDPVDAVRLMLRLVTIRMDYIEMVADMTGDALPKIDPQSLIFPES